MLPLFFFFYLIVCLLACVDLTSFSLPFHHTSALSILPIPGSFPLLFITQRLSFYYSSVFLPFFHCLFFTSLSSITYFLLLLPLLATTTTLLAPTSPLSLHWRCRLAYDWSKSKFHFGVFVLFFALAATTPPSFSPLHPEQSVSECECLRFLWPWMSAAFSVWTYSNEYFLSMRECVYWSVCVYVCVYIGMCVLEWVYVY